MCVNEDNRSLDERLGTDQFVIRGIVRDIHHTDFAGTDFGTPREVTAVESEGPKLEIAPAAAHIVNPRLANLRHGSRTAQFELALLTVLFTTTSGLPALVAAFTSNTRGYYCGVCWALSHDGTVLVDTVSVDRVG